MTHGITETINGTHRKRSVRSFNELDGWKRIEALPSLDEFNRFLSKRATIDRATWEGVAQRFEEFRSSREFNDGDRKLVGLNFAAWSGSIMIGFPVDPYTSGPEHAGRLYIMGETRGEAYSALVRQLHDEIEKLILPAVAHAGDGG